MRRLLMLSYAMPYDYAAYDARFATLLAAALAADAARRYTFLFFVTRRYFSAVLRCQRLFMLLPRAAPAAS